MSQATQFGDMIRRRRMDLNISVRDLARKIGVSHVFLGEVERGTRPTIGEAHWNALSLALQIPLEQIREAARRSAAVKLDLRGVAPEQAVVLEAFARRVANGSLSPERIAEIRRILEEGK